MTRDDINRTIRANKELITSYNNEINKYEDQIKELKNLKSKFLKIQTDFVKRQKNRRKNLRGDSSVKEKVKFISSYISGMTLFLGGLKYGHAYASLTLAQKTIQDEIERIDKKITDCKNKILKLNNRNIYWNGQLKKAAN